MDKKEIESLKKKEIKELENLLVDKRSEHLLSYNQVKANQEKNTRKPTNIRKEIAQILTVIKEKTLIEEANMGKTKTKGKEGDK